MAGAGYKLFNTGDVLTAAQVNTYLQEQTVMVFASSTARTTALSGVLAEGMMSYLQDTNSVEVYNGSSWVNVGNAGDITEVQAGTGISVASGTGPIPIVSSLAINKNYLINGGFAIAQRGTSFTASNNNDDAYTLDRWYILSDTNDVIDVTQDTTTVPTNGQFAIALDVETVNKKFGIATIIENKDVIGLVGNTVTFSFKAKVSSTTKLDNVKAAIVAWSGTADSVTSDIVSAWNVEGTNPTLIANATYENSPVNLNLTTSYATYTVSGAIDTASTKNLILFIWSDVTDTTLGDFLYVAEAKLELGSSATAFEYAGGTLAGELAACQRYYWRTTGQAAADNDLATGWSNSTTSAIAIIRFPVTMRTAATGATSGATDFGFYWSGGKSTSTATAIDRISSEAVYLRITTAGLTTNGAGGMVINSGTTKWFEASAEL